MKTSILAALALVATAAVVAPTANAAHFCNGAGQVVDLAGQGYVTVDEVLGEDGYLFSIWVYLESNGQTNLQRGGVTLAGDADICQDSLTPDTGVF